MYERRNHLRTLARLNLVASAALVMGIAVLCTNPGYAEDDKYAWPADSALPPSDMTMDLSRTALVITDPQIDFLSEKGVAWGLVGKNVTELNTVENIGRLFAAAKKAGIHFNCSRLHFT